MYAGVTMQLSDRFRLVARNGLWEAKLRLSE
jgi:hypothetical protein